MRQPTGDWLGPDYQELHAVTAAGPRQLEVPAGLSDPTHVYDILPRGIYEALRTFEHVRFVGLAEHLDRAQRSIRSFGLEGELDESTLRHCLHGIVEGFPAPDARVRFDVLSGPATALGAPERVLVQAVPLALPTPEVYLHGVRAGLTDAVRRERPAIKEAQWVVDRREAFSGSEEDYEPILVDGDGRLLEGLMSNLFLVRCGELWTAPVEDVLAGVTRGILVDLARGLRLPVREEFVRRDEIETVDEAFFSTSVRSVLPVAAIDGQELGGGSPGPLTRRMMEVYREFCEEQARPAIPE